MRYFAQIGPDNRVTHVSVAESYAACVDVLPDAHWEETLQGHSTERSAGIGMVFVPSDPRRFLRQEEIDGGD